MPTYAKLDASFDYSLESSAYALLVVDPNTADHLYIKVKELHNTDLYKYYEELFGEAYDRGVYVDNNTIIPNDDALYIAEEEKEDDVLDYSMTYLEGFKDDGYIDAPISVAKGYATVVVMNAMDVDSPQNPNPPAEVEGPSVDETFLKLLNTIPSFKRTHFAVEKLPPKPYCTKMAPILINSLRMQLGKRPAKPSGLKCEIIRYELGDYFIFTIGEEKLYLSCHEDAFKDPNYERHKYLGGVFHYLKGSDFEKLLNAVTKSYIWHGLSITEPDPPATSRKRACITPAPTDREEGEIP